MDTDEARAARERLVAQLAERHPIAEAVLEAMRRVPRHLFADAPLERAYEDTVLHLGHGQTLSQPYIVAVMTDALEIHGTEGVLEIGTGSGYQAAVLSLLARRVDSIEILPALADPARQRLRELGYRNVEVHTGDGYRGWPERAPFDRILLTAAPPRVPEALFDQLGEGGVLVAPVGERSCQRLVRWRRSASGVASETLEKVVFVPMVRG
jgi:protein-L-isoaspartate(D-aspartate) O-methyltransferase